MLSAIKHRRIFDPERTVYAQRSMDLCEHHFEHGEEIPWLEIGVELQTMQVLFRQRIVSHFPDGDASPEAQEAYHPGRTFPERTEFEMASSPPVEPPAELTAPSPEEIPAASDDVVSEAPAEMTEVTEEAVAPVEEPVAETVEEPVAAPAEESAEADPQTDDGVGDEIVEAPAVVVTEEIKKRSRRRS